MEVLSPQSRVTMQLTLMCFDYLHYAGSWRQSQCGAEAAVLFSTVNVLEGLRKGIMD
jgi:hypothetical protein